MIVIKSYLFLTFCVVGLTLCQPATDEGTTAGNQENPYLTDEITLQHGMELFNQHCASCHNFSENGIGPNLSGVTSSVDKQWLMSFIQNPSEVIESGDARAVGLFEKYNQYMPAFSMLAEQDLEHILGFVHKFSEGEKRNKSNRSGGILNPIPTKIASSGLALVVEQQLVVPPSSEVPPITRINKMNAIPGGRVFIHDLRGKLYEISDDNQLSVYLDLAEELPEFIDNPGKGTGFGSWAFHPEFQQNGLFYTTHFEPSGTATADFPVPDSIRIAMQGVLLEWKTNHPKATSFSGTKRELLRVDMAGGAHTFQEVTFNPLAVPGSSEYGLLYLGIGDATTALRGYTFLCDNKQHIWGSVIRIDPAGSSSTNGKYGIPSDNPFVNDPTAVPESWAYGFRNPHRISWDETGSGKMFITNIGQHSVEEINLGKPGANYGWPHREGNFLFDVDANRELVYPLPVDDEGYTYPVAQYDHDEGSAVSGGFVYSGINIPALQGKYIFGDISLGTLFYSEVSEMNDGQEAPVYRMQLVVDGKLTDMETITGSKRVDLRIGTDAQGELYLLSKANGGVYKVLDVIELDRSTNS